MEKEDEKMARDGNRGRTDENAVELSMSVVEWTKIMSGRMHDLENMVDREKEYVKELEKEIKELN